MPRTEYRVAPVEYVAAEPIRQTPMIPGGLPQPTATPDPCDSLDVPPGASVAQVVGATDLKAGQDTVTRAIVVRYARLMCKGSQAPAIDIVHGATFDTIYDGHHRYVASRLAQKPIARKVVHDFSAKGFDWPQSFEWSFVRWN
jgi:hypothetical protein